MTSDFDTPDAPQDTGPPDAVETDPAALNSAEDLDEDRLKLDPLEAGMDPPEHWSGVDKYGMTPYEQSHPRPLADRLDEEQPDVQPASGEPAAGEQNRDDVVSLDARDAYDAEVHREAAERGQLADEPGGSVAESMRTPDDGGR
ncbi:hypothetical protein AB0I60_00715 [Actinosynnema sp. NPDC050436]|uniref:hypothetical protein n=1 Tax=Actinosynnema sp. NPDC050436 TaxID=3155659 RepID=UPI0033E50E94